MVVALLDNEFAAEHAREIIVEHNKSKYSSFN